jgi:hypothetical protein
MLKVNDSLYKRAFLLLLYGCWTSCLFSCIEPVPDEFPQCIAKKTGDQTNGCSCATISIAEKSNGLWEPEFSPDGLRLYFNNWPFGPQTDLYVIVRNTDTEPFAAQTAQRLPETINSNKSDRGACVIRGADGSDRIFFVSEREGPGSIYETSIPIIDGKPVLNSSITTHKIQGSVSQTTVLNVYVYPDESAMIFNGPGVCSARFFIAKKADDYTWNVDPEANAIVQEINQWADSKDLEEPCGWPCEASCGLLDPHVTQDGRSFYFVRTGDIYRAQRDSETGSFLGSTITQISEIETNVCPHPQRAELWVEGPTTHLDTGGYFWLFYHSAGQFGRIGGYRWP